MIRLFRIWWHRRKLAADCARRRASFETQDYRRRREAALKATRPQLFTAQPK